MEHCISDLSRFDVSETSGFLPSELPLERIPNDYYAPWEDIMAQLPQLISTERIRSKIDSLPKLSTLQLTSTREWRRAYVCLSFMFNAYVWGEENAPAQKVPPCLSIPLLEACETLGVPPITTFASVCLWNYRTVPGTEDTTRPANLRSINTFTGTEDEQWFYCISVAIESRGAATIPLMMRAILAAQEGDTRSVTRDLLQFSDILVALARLLNQMYERCDPTVFYSRIRRFLAGTNNMARFGLPDGVSYDLGGGNDLQSKTYAGGSNAQSSLVQFFDIVLGVEHGNGFKGQESRDSCSSVRSFLLEMRSYMPGMHRQFLEELSCVSGIKHMVMKHSDDADLSAAYESCLKGLCSLRDHHIRLAHRYIVKEQRRSMRGSVSVCVSAPAQGTSSGEASSPRGTGGTDAIGFLKQSRQNTAKTTLKVRVRSFCQASYCRETLAEAC